MSTLIITDERRTTFLTANSEDFCVKVSRRKDEDGGYCALFYKNGCSIAVGRTETKEDAKTMVNNVVEAIICHNYKEFTLPYEEKEDKRVVELTYIGCNDYDKPIYKTAGGRLFVDAEPDNEDAPLYALSGNKVDGEPEVALRNINGFEDVEIVFTPRRINFRDPVHKALYFKRLYGEGEDNE